MLGKSVWCKYMGKLSWRSFSSLLYSMHKKPPSREGSQDDPMTLTMFHHFPLADYISSPTQSPSKRTYCIAWDRAQINRNTSEIDTVVYIIQDIAWRLKCFQSVLCVWIEKELTMTRHTDLVFHRCGQVHIKCIQFNWFNDPNAKSWQT